VSLVADALHSTALECRDESHSMWNAAREASNETVSDRSPTTGHRLIAIERVKQDSS